MLEGAQKHRAFCQALKFAGRERSMLAQQLQTVQQIARQPELMPRLKRTCQVVEFINAAGSGLKVRRRLAPLQPCANPFNCASKSGRVAICVMPFRTACKARSAISLSPATCRILR